MAYTPSTWADGEAGGTPITAAALNKIENGVGAADTAANTAPTWASVTGKPSTFAPATHTHAEADVTGLVAKLADLESRLAALEAADPA